MALILPASGCPGCGSRSINAQGVCDYCLTRVVLPAAASPPASDSADEPDATGLLALAAVQQMRLRAELRFLEEQWAETAHPSLPPKIARVRQQLDDAASKPRSPK